MLEAVAEAATAQAATQPMLTLQDEDTTDTTLRAKVQRPDSDGFEVVENPVTESQSKEIAEDQDDKILQQMALLSESVQLLGTQMREGFETEGIRRKEDYKNLEEKMAFKVEEGYKKEQHARQQVQSEIAQGFKNEENARQLAQTELAIIKDEIKNLKGGQWQYCLQRGLYWSGAGVARPPPLSSRWNETFI